MASQESVLTIDSFSGLNIRDSSNRIKDSELVECQNFDIGLSGELSKRTGFKTLNSVSSLGANAVTLLGYFQTDTITQLLARIGQNIYFSVDGGDTWVICPGGPHGNVEFGIQYTNKFYFVRRDNILLEWNGVAMTAIAGSPMGSHICVFKDRLFILNTYIAGTLSSRLYFSKIADFSATGWPGTNFIDVSPGDGDYLVACILLQDVLFVFKARSTWMLYVSGDPSNWILRNGSPEIGCISRYTPREIESQLYFVGLRGVYRTDGTTFTEISEHIKSIFSSQVINTAELNKTFAAWWGDKYIVFISLVHQASTWDSNANNSWDSVAYLTWDAISGSYYQCYVYYLRLDMWSRWEPNSDIAPFTFIEINQPSNHRGLLCGSRKLDGKVFRYGESLYQDGGGNYSCRFKTKDFSLENLSSKKRGKLIVVEFDSIGLITFINYVNGMSRVAQAIITASGRLVYKLKGPHYFRTWQLSFEATHENPLSFYGLSLYMHRKNTVIKSGV